MAEVWRVISDIIMRKQNKGKKKRKKQERSKKEERRYRGRYGENNDELPDCQIE